MQIFSVLRNALHHFPVDDGTLNAKVHKLLDEMEGDLDSCDWEPHSDTEDMMEDLGKYIDNVEAEDSRVDSEESNSENEDDKDEKVEDFIGLRKEDDENDDEEDEDTSDEEDDDKKIED